MHTSKNRNILIAALLMMSLIAPNLFPQIELKTNEWLQNWLLCGPFPLQSVSELTPDIDHLPGFETDFLKAHGGETNPKIQVGQVEKFKGGSATWIKYSSPDSCVSLDEAVSRNDFVLAYGYNEIFSPTDEVCLLALGTNDGGRMWLNGEQIWDRAEGRGLMSDDDLLPVSLRKGKNTILLKIEERGNKWGFCVRFLAFDAVKFFNQAPIFKVVTAENGKSFFRYSQPATVLKRILKIPRLTIFTQINPDKPLWQRELKFEPEIVLALDPNRFQKYILKFEAELSDGKRWSKEITFSAGKRIEYVLFDQGKTDYVIVPGTDASESEQWAASELQFWLKEVSGAELPILSDSDRITQHKIVVGFNNSTKNLLGENIQPPKSEDESFVYQNIGPDIVIYGGKQRGTMYGVLSFLENELGCRWYTPTVSVAPQKQQYVFDYLYHTESPVIRVRNDFYFEAFDPIWAARNKINGAMSYRQQIGGVECYWSVHTFYRFMPPAEFYSDHPEYYSLIDGKRIADHAQFCLTNPEVLQIVTERLKQTMREQPEYLIYSVSQNDWRNPCQCEQCQAIAQREESEAGPLIWFVNQVAENIESEFPDKFVGTLAYQYTRKPPKSIQPRHNVVIRLCSIECCFAHDFNSCPENESFISDLKGWANISPHLYIWDYVVNFSHYIMPYPNFRVLQSNIETFRDNKAIGIMEQAAYQSRGGEFAELRAYVIAKLLWNPECDVEQVINDFMYGYYGRAGQFVRLYFDLLHNRLTPETHIHLGLNPDDKLFSDEFVREAEAIFDQAEAVADNEQIRQRVELARLPIMYLKCKRSPLEARYDGTYERFQAIVKREGITHYAEAGQPHREMFHKQVERAK